MVRMGEASPYSSIASPNRCRAGCVSAFLNFFDWTPAKRFTSSTKRLTSGKQKPEKVFRRSRSDHNSPRKPSRMMCQSGANVAVLDHTSRAPGVVARLMGLESLPHPHRHHQRRSQSDTPILLQDLLKRDYKSRRRREESKFRKKSSSLLTAFRCRPEVSCVSPAYIDGRLLCTVRTSPFLSRLPQTPRDESPSFAPAHHEAIPELGLRATTAGTTVLLQGWPLESQRIVPPDIFDEEEELDVTSTTAIVALGRRRGSSESGAEQENVRKTGRVRRGVSRADEFGPSPGRYRGEIVFKTARRPARSGGKSSSRSSTVTSQDEYLVVSAASVSSKAPTGLVGKEIASKAWRVKSNLDEDEPKRAVARSKEMKPPLPKVRNQRAEEKYSAKGAADCVSKGAADGASEGAGYASKGPGFASNGASSLLSQSWNMSTSFGVKFFGGRKEGDRAPVHVKKKSGALGPSRPPLQRFSEKANSGTQPTKQVQDFGERLKKGSSADVTATQISSSAIDESAMLRFKRKNKQHHARARSVDKMFPDLPLENPKPVERVLFVSSPDMEFSTDCKQISSSPLVDFATGACIVGRLSVSFEEDYEKEDYEKENYEKEDNDKKDYEKEDYKEDCEMADYVKVDYEKEHYEKEDYEEDYEELQTDVLISNSPLVDCHEKLPDNVSGEGDECLSWEDKAAGLTVSTLCCSGPSVSSGSLPSDVEDIWSTYAESQLDLDCYSPRPFQITRSIEVVVEEHQNSPPAQFVKKRMDSLVDEELAPQPSPVSILDSPFLDEPCTPEPTLTGSIHRKLNSEEEELNPSVNTCDKLRQALLDISMFRTWEDSSAAPPCEPKDERTFIRGVLVAASFLGPSSPKWHDRNVAIDPSLFDNLESGDTEFTCQQAVGVLWRCNRKLLFDCVNEVLHHEEEGMVLWRLGGERLVAEVGKRIDGWRTLASHAIDSLIEWDMSTWVGSWKRFGCEAEEVGMEVERSVWGDLLDEVVSDMVVSKDTQLPKIGVD